MTALLRAILRRAQLAYFRFCLRCVTDEREAYQLAGVPLGPQYLANSERQASVLRSRIALLEIGADL